MSSHLFNITGGRHELGGIKIGQFDWQKEQARPNLPNEFSALDESFFSLGQDVSYYSAVAALGQGVASTLLSALKDVVGDPALFPRCPAGSSFVVRLEDNSARNCGKS
jgi:hypothetical protein